METTNNNVQKIISDTIYNMNFKASNGEIFGIFQLKFKINQAIKDAIRNSHFSEEVTETLTGPNDISNENTRNIDKAQRTLCDYKEVEDDNSTDIQEIKYRNNPLIFRATPEQITEVARKFIKDNYPRGKDDIAIFDEMPLMMRHTCKTKEMKKDILKIMRLNKNPHEQTDNIYHICKTCGHKMFTKDESSKHYLLTGHSDFYNGAPKW